MSEDITKQFWEKALKDRDEKGTEFDWTLIKYWFEDENGNSQTPQVGAIFNGVKWEATCKWDGCVDLWIGEEKDTDYLHICNLDKFIENLVKLRDEWGQGD